MEVADINKAKPIEIAGAAMKTVIDATRDMNGIAELTATEFLSLLKKGQISVEHYVRHCADRIARREPGLKAWHAYDEARALDKARALDRLLRQGAALKPLTGVPVGVKDIFNTYDYRTGMGSEIMDGYTPGNDARVVSDIRLAGGIVMGKTVTAEFAVHHPGPTVHPLDPSRSPGTSSSGSAVAVATGMVPVSICSQTAGSIIRPASYCGIFGYKPSFGLIPRTGILKTTDTLDTVGFMARSVDDLALMFEVCRVRGHNYPVSEAALNDTARQTPALGAGGPWRVGVVAGPETKFETPAARAGLDALLGKLADAGCEVAPYRLPARFEEAHSAHERIHRKALAYYFNMEWRANAALFSPSLQEMIEGGHAVSPRQYQDDIALQRDLSRLIDRESGNFDVLVGLSTAGEAPMGLEGTDLPDHCLIWTMCGMPAISLPRLKGQDSLPVGVQIVARRFNDYLALDFARELEGIAAT